MSTYVDSSALLKRYVEEADSTAADALLRADHALLTARHTIVEVRRNLARLLSGRDLVAARAAFADDLRSISIVELDEATCESAASIAEATCRVRKARTRQYFSIWPMSGCVPISSLGMCEAYRNSVYNRL